MSSHSREHGGGGGDCDVLSCIRLALSSGGFPIGDAAADASSSSVVTVDAASAMVSVTLPSSTSSSAGRVITFSSEAKSAYRSEKGRGARYSALALCICMTTPEVVALKSSMLSATVPTLIAASTAVRKRMPAEHAAGVVKYVDLKDLCLYLWGKNDTSECVDPAELKQPQTAQLAPSAAPEVDKPTAARKREKALRDRNTSLCCRSKTFDRIVALIDNADRSKAEAAKMVQEARNGHGHKGGAAGRHQQQASRGGRYEWTGDVQGNVEAAYWREALGEEAKDLEGIQTYGQTANVSSAAVVDLAPPSKRARSSQPHASSSMRYQQQANVKKVVRRPIIFVPAGYPQGSLLNMLNIKTFLEDGKFVDWANLVDSATEKKERIIVKRSYRKAKPVEYEIRDKVPQFADAGQRAEFWERIVAVCVSGAGWQFKDWPWKDERKESVDFLTTFAKVRGFQVRWRDDLPDERTRPWDVERLFMEKNSRHGDTSVMHRFWDVLDTHLKKRLANKNPTSSVILAL